MSGAYLEISYLQSLAIEFANRLKARGMRVPDLAMAGGFSTEDGVYKALAMGTPYFKAVCMGRSLMIPGMVGKNIQDWLAKGDLPKTVSKFGSKPEEIFVAYEDLKANSATTSRIYLMAPWPSTPDGQKFKTGLQQLMAGSRNFRLSTMCRDDLMALTEEAAKVSGIPYVMQARRAEAEKVLDALQN